MFLLTRVDRVPKINNGKLLPKDRHDRISDGEKQTRIKR